MRVSRRWARVGSFSVSFSRESRRASSSSEADMMDCVGLRGIADKIELGCYFMDDIS